VSSTDDPTLADALQAAVRSAVGQVRTAVPAVLLSYDRSTQRARIRPTVRIPFRDPSTGLVSEYVQLPAVSNVPVQWVGGANGSITVDPAEGDTGMMMLCDRDIAAWKRTGNEDTSPGDTRRMDLSDAVFILGLYSDADLLPSSAYAEGAMVLRSDDVRLGSASASSKVALNDEVASDFTTLKNAISAAPVTPTDGGAAFKASLVAALSAWPTASGATKVKAE